MYVCMHVPYVYIHVCAMSGPFKDKAVPYFTVSCSSGQLPLFCSNPGSAGSGSSQVAGCSTKTMT